MYVLIFFVIHSPLLWLTWLPNSINARFRKWDLKHRLLNILLSKRVDDWTKLCHGVISLLSIHDKRANTVITLTINSAFIVTRAQYVSCYLLVVVFLPGQTKQNLLGICTCDPWIDVLALYQSETITKDHKQVYATAWEATVQGSLFMSDIMIQTTRETEFRFK